MVITDEKLKAYVESPISNEFGLSIAQVANAGKTYGRFSALVNGNIPQITEVLTIVKQAGMSPAFFAAYEATEGYNSKWGWLNHTTQQGSYTNDARSVAQKVVTTSKSTSFNPSWIDYGNPVDFVPQSVKTEGNAHFTSMPLGTIGRAFIPLTAAATWEVYYPNGLKKEYNQVQNYGAPLNHSMNLIEGWGGTIANEPVEPPEPDEETPDNPNNGIDIQALLNNIEKEVFQMLSKDLTQSGGRQFYQNRYVQIMNQLGTSFKVKVNDNFKAHLQTVFDDFNEGYIPPDPEEPEPEPEPEEPSEGLKVFPVKLGNGINFWKRSNWGVGTLQRNMTYGIRSSGQWHYGYDIGGGGVNHTIYSVTNGEVVQADFANGIGYRIRIKNDDDVYYLQYGHLKSFLVNVGDIVQAGDSIAIMGDTGGNYAIHLDLKISPNINGFGSETTTIDPEKYLEITADNKTSLPLPS